MLHQRYLPAVRDRLRAIDACLDAGRTAEAAKLAREAIAAGLTDARLHRLVAHDLEQQGRFDEALAELSRGLELDATNLDLVLGVGFCLIRLDRHPEAVHVFRNAVAIAPGSEHAWLGLGVALRFAPALAEARQALERVLSLNPRHARALAELAGIHESQGRRDEAKTLADRALAYDAEDIEAQIVLAKVALMDGDYATAEKTAREKLALPEIAPAMRAELRFLKADALDGQGRAEEAFEAYGAANAEVRRRFAGVFEAPGRESACDGAERALAEFVATPAERWASPSTEPTGPVFLFGFPRSGTTLLENILASHPGVVCLEEKPTLADSAGVFLGGAGGIERLSRIPSSDLGAFRAAYWRRVREFADPAGKVFVDKQPLGTFALPLVAKLFPNARILFPLRDPRDVVLSCFRRDFRMNASLFEFTVLERAARYYDVAMRSHEAFASRLPLACHEVRYERLVEDFDAEVKAACAFLGLEWTEAMRDFSQTALARGVNSRSSNQVTQGLNRRGLAQWRRYARALEPVMPTVAPWVARFGYPA